MKPALLATVLLIACTAPVLAGPCDDDLKRVDAALASDAVPAEQKAQVQDMRSQAAKLCGAGNEQEGVDVLTEAKAMLAIE